MRRKIEFISDYYYHIYSRGVEKREIFLDDNDYFRFLLLLYLSNNTGSFHLSKYFLDRTRIKEKIDRGKPLTEREKKLLLHKLPDLFKVSKEGELVSIVAHCQMPNHFHLLVREKQDGGISKFMEKLLTAFAKYFNTKYERSGSLFVNPFKAKHVDKDSYLIYLLAYIHLNPVKLIDPKWKENGIKDRRKAKKFLEEYRYSSYLDYLGKERIESAVLNREDLPEYYIGEGFEDFVDSWLGYEDKNIF